MAGPPSSELDERRLLAGDEPLGHATTRCATRPSPPAARRSATAAATRRVHRAARLRRRPLAAPTARGREHGAVEHEVRHVGEQRLVLAADGGSPSAPLATTIGRPRADRDGLELRRRREARTAAPAQPGRGHQVDEGRALARPSRQARRAFAGARRARPARRPRADRQAAAAAGRSTARRPGPRLGSDRAEDAPGALVDAQADAAARAGRVAPRRASTICVPCSADDPAEVGAWRSRRPVARRRSPSSRRRRRRGRGPAAGSRARPDEPPCVRPVMSTSTSPFERPSTRRRRPVSVAVNGGAGRVCAGERRRPRRARAGAASRLCGEQRRRRSRARRPAVPRRAGSVPDAASASGDAQRCARAGSERTRRAVRRREPDERPRRRTASDRGERRAPASSRGGRRCRCRARGRARPATRRTRASGARATCGSRSARAAGSSTMSASRRSKATAPSPSQIGRYGETERHDRVREPDRREAVGDRRDDVDGDEREREQRQVAVQAGDDEARPAVAAPARRSRARRARRSP